MGKPLSRAKDWSGRRVRNFIVTGPARRDADGAVWWTVRCDCGFVREKRASVLGALGQWPATACGGPACHLPTRTTFIDRVGQRFGRLVVVRKVGKHPTRWECLCDCGDAIVATPTNLIRGHHTSCGCRRDELTAARVTTHGAFAHRTDPKYRRLYTVWRATKQRCYNRNDRAWINYGGRGIAVCDRWRNSFENFRDDMGVPPSPLHQLDRINNDGDYSPENCRWATPSENGRNKRNTRVLTHQGETRPLIEWAGMACLPVELVRTRVDIQGWSVERALTTPRRNSYRSRFWVSHPCA